MALTKRARIKDVAEHSGVSMMTVSRVLSNVGKVSDKTRQLVLSAAQQLNYRPNVAARRLAGSKSFFLGLVYNNPSASYVSQFLLGALKACRAQGYHLVVDESGDELEKCINSISELIEVTQVDGLILLPPLCDEPKIIAALQESSVPFVRISPDNNLNASPYICMDDYQAAFEITERLINQGHSLVGHIIGDPNQGVSRLRYQGFLDALRSNQINLPPEYIVQGNFTYKSGLTATAQLLSLPVPPTAIFAGNDDMAAAAISKAHSMQIDVPEKLAVVGFDDIQLATSVWPQITTVKQPIAEMAELAIEMLVSGKFADITKCSPQNFRHVLDFNIIERESSSRDENK